MMRIVKIEVVYNPDEFPFDEDIYGKYASEPGPDDRTVDREASRDIRQGEYRYFVAALSGDETGNPESVEQDYARMEALNRGEWYFESVEAKAVIRIDLPNDHSLPYFLKIPSLGIFGVESNCEADEKRNIARDEIAYLKDVLEAMDVDMSNFDTLAQGALDVM